MIKITQEQMTAIQEAKLDKLEEGKSNLERILSDARKRNWINVCEPINDMTEEEIVLAWHGYVEVKVDYVDFYKAMKAVEDVKRVVFHSVDEGEHPFVIVSDESLEDTRMARYSLLELIHGEFTIGEKK